MFSTMVLGLIQESATELHYTLQDARQRALEPVKDPAGEQMMGPRLAIVNSSPLGGAGTWDAWSLEADSYKI